MERKGATPPVVVFKNTNERELFLRLLRQAALQYAARREKEEVPCPED